MRKQDTASAVERDRSPHPKSLYLQSTDAWTAIRLLSFCRYFAKIADATGAMSLSLVKFQVKKFLSAACPQGPCAEVPFCVTMTVAIEFHSRALITQGNIGRASATRVAPEFVNFYTCIAARSDRAVFLDFWQLFSGISLRLTSSEFGMEPAR